VESHALHVGWDRWESPAHPVDMDRGATLPPFFLEKLKKMGSYMTSFFQKSVTSWYIKLLSCPRKPYT
jgi:hypothetical protein